MSYLEATHDLYKSAAENPDIGLCCTTTPIWQLPGLAIPGRMMEMNYGCGSTVHPRDLVNDPKVLYVGVGGGMELLQFAYFSRLPGAITGVDVVPEMLDASRQNFDQAELLNPWFQKEFIQLKLGSALSLPVEDSTIDVAAQNCLFNIFKKKDLQIALTEMYRVLKPHGRLVLSDPICEQGIPPHLTEDHKLRAQCLSGALPLGEYIDLLTDTGFGTVEIRARRPYRVLTSNHYNVEKSIVIESVEVCAIKDPVPADGPCVFTGKTALYTGDEDFFDDKKGHVLPLNQPISICDKTASALAAIKNPHLHISQSTFFYDGGGCC